MTNESSDENISDTTSTKQPHPTTENEIKKGSKSTWSSSKLRDLKVVVAKLDAVSMIVAPLPRRVGFSVQPPSAAINPLNKSLVPGVGNYPARKSKRSAHALSCCVGCTAENACKKTKPSGTQVRRKCDKNVGLKRKYVKKSATTTSKRRSDVCRFGSRSMLNPSMVHQYRFNPQSRLSDALSTASSLDVHLPQRMEPKQAFTTEEISPLCSVTPGSLTSASPTAITSPGVASLQQPQFPPNPTSAIDNLGVASSQQSRFLSNPASVVRNPGVASLQRSHFPPIPASVVSNTGVASLRRSHFPPNLASIVSNPGVESLQQSHFPPNPASVVSNPGIASLLQSRFPLIPASSVGSPGVSSLQQSGFPSLPPLPLREPYVTAVPVCAASSLVPLYVPPEKEPVQAGNQLIPVVHNILHGPHLHPFMGCCSMHPENNSQHHPTGAQPSGAFNSNPLTAGVSCPNSTSFQLQAYGSQNVSTNAVSSNRTKDQVSYGASIESPNDDVADCSDAGVGYNVSTSNGSAVVQMDYVGSYSTGASYHGYNIGTSSASNSTIGRQPQSDSETMFSISSLLPEMSCESEPTLQDTMPSPGKGKNKTPASLKTLLTRLSKKDVNVYRWLTELLGNRPHVTGIPSLKRHINSEELHFTYLNNQSLKLCDKLQHSIGTYKENIARDVRKHDVVVKKLGTLSTLEKPDVEPIEAELNELLAKVKVHIDLVEELETKWFRKTGTQLITNSSFKRFKS